MIIIHHNIFKSLRTVFSYFTVWCCKSYICDNTRTLMQKYFHYIPPIRINDINPNTRVSINIRFLIIMLKTVISNNLYENWVAISVAAFSYFPPPLSFITTRSPSSPARKNIVFKWPMEMPLRASRLACAFVSHFLCVACSYVWIFSFSFSFSFYFNTMEPEEMKHFSRLPKFVSIFMIVDSARTSSNASCALNGFRSMSSKRLVKL